jgi:hypothetical protein
MSNVATFELKTHIEASIVRDRASQHWNGLGYEADVCQWWADTPNRILCVLEYFFYGDSHEAAMMVATVKYLLSISQESFIYYYRSIDFVGDLDCEGSSYFGGCLVKNITVEDLYLSQYQPSMASTDIFKVQSRKTKPDQASSNQAADAIVRRHS